MNIDLNIIINAVLALIVGYISWTFKDRDEKKEARIKFVEEKIEGLNDKVSQNDTKYYQEFITREQHDMDINSILKKIDELNISIRNLTRDIGILIGRGESKNG